MQVPFTLGQYDVVGQVGTGGFATVYRAKVTGDMGFSRDVALKLLHPHITAEMPDVVAMLADEARLLARMQHPNIVYVQWFGKIDGRFAMTMEYVEGRSWRSLLDESRGMGRPVPLSVILDVHTDIARALEFAHSLKGDDGVLLGLVHRDLKPDNVMVSSAGVVKLLDFGIAKARDRIAQATQTELVRGTVHYMGPVQVLGVKDLDFRSDLFSFGAMLYEAACGKRLIEADTVVSAVRQLADFDPTERLAEAAERAPQVAPLLERLVAADRAERFASTSELVEALVQLRGTVTGATSTRWLAMRAEPLGDTTAIVTPAGVGTSSSGAAFEETVDIHTDKTTAQVPPGRSEAPVPGAHSGVAPTRAMERTAPAGTETRPIARGRGPERGPGGRRGPAVGLALIAVGVLLGAFAPKWFAKDEPVATPPVAEPDPGPGPAEPGDVGAEADGVAGMEIAAEEDAVAADMGFDAIEDVLENENENENETENENESENEIETENESGSEPAAAAGPDPEPVPAAPGLVRLAADHPFSVTVGGKTYTQLEARRGITLPPGEYDARFSCLACPEGVEPTKEIHLMVTAGEEAVRKVKFEAAP